MKEIRSTRVDAEPHTIFTMLLGGRSVFSAVVLPLGKEMAVSTSLAPDVNPLLVLLDLLLVASEVPGISPSTRAHLLANAAAIGMDAPIDGGEQKNRSSTGRVERGSDEEVDDFPF